MTVIVVGEEVVVVRVRGWWRSYQEGRVHGRLGRVDDEVAQGEAEAHGRASQAHRLGPRPGEGLLFRQVGPCRRLRKVGPLQRVILLKGRGRPSTLATS